MAVAARSSPWLWWLLLRRRIPRFRNWRPTFAFRMWLSHLYPDVLKLLVASLDMALESCDCTLEQGHFVRGGLLTVLELHGVGPRLTELLLETGYLVSEIITHFPIEDVWLILEEGVVKAEP